MFRKKNIYCATESSLHAKSTEILNQNKSSLLSSDNSINQCSFNYKPFLGLFYTATTSVFITLTSVFVKQLSYISPGQLSMVRNIGVWTGCLPIAVYSVKEVWGAKKDRPMLVVRGFLGATSLYLNLTAFRYLPLAEAAVIMSTMPAVITVIARVFLKESCGLVQGFALLITLCGVLLSVRLQDILKGDQNSKFDTKYIFGLTSAVGCVCLLSVAFVALRKMKDIHFSVSLLYTGFIGMLENGAISLSTTEFAPSRCGWDQVLVLLIGIFGFIGHCTLTLAIQVEAVGVVSVMKASTDIIIAIIFQFIFFRMIPDFYSISGACLVILSVSVVGLKKWLIELPESSKTKKRLKWLLL